MKEKSISILLSFPLLSKLDKLPEKKLKETTMKYYQFFITILTRLVTNLGRMRIYTSG